MLELNEKKLKKMKSNVVQKSPIIDSPFEKYGNTVGDCCGFCK